MIDLRQLAILHLGVAMIAIGFLDVLDVINGQAILMGGTLIAVSLLSSCLGQVYSSTLDDNGNLAK